MNGPPPSKDFIIARRGIGPVPLGELPFENTFVEAMPADPVEHNVPRQVRNASYTRVVPTPVRAPRLLAWSSHAARLLGLADPATPDGLEAEVLGGNRVLPGMKPYAARYGGHQFGHWAGQLGDGRALTLAEAIAADGSRQELQLKGAGARPTPAPPTAAPCCDRRCASSSAARPCTTSACRPRERCPSSVPERR